MTNVYVKPASYGVGASGLLLSIYFAVLALVSGWEFARVQFSQFWYFIVSLALGFGAQIGLYVYLRGLVKDKSTSAKASADKHGGPARLNEDGRSDGGKVLGVTGTTSTAAMISCCTHYLANLLPILGTVGIVTFVAQYQVELFWIGILFNLGGIVYIASRINKFS